MIPTLTLPAAISIVLLVISLLLWLERGEEGSVLQGVLLAALMVAWFLRIVLV